MNRIFRRLPLPVKLMLIGIIPLVFLVFISFQYYSEKAWKLKQLEGFITRINVSADISSLIDNLQKEGKLSFDYVIRKFQQSELDLQKPRTDAIISKLENSDDSSLTGFRNFTSLDRLDDIRKQITEGTATQNQVVHFYSSTIFRLNTINAIPLVSNIYLSPLMADLAVQKLLAEIITYLNIISTNIYNVLQTRQYMIETLMGTYGTYEVYKSYDEELSYKASPSDKLAYKELLSSTSLKPMIAFIDTLFTRFSFDSTYSADQWWQVSDNGIKELNKFREEIWHRVNLELNRIYTNEKNEKNLTLGFLIAAIILVALIVSYTLNIINRALRDIKNAAERLSRGESGITLKEQPDDVIGGVAKSILKIDENDRALAEAADQIGRGNFEVKVQPRSEADRLGNAVKRMKHNLQHFTKELQDSQEHFRQLADSMPQIVWTARPDGYLDYYNNQWYEYTGFEEGYGDNSWTPILHPHDRQPCLDAWYRSVKTGEPYQFEYRFKDRKNEGNYRWFLGRAYPVKNREGEVVKWFGTCTDIHDQKVAEENLEMMVEERTKELQNVNKNLEKSNAELEQFAYVASHDLQEPLRKIQAFSSMLEKKNEGEFDDTSRFYVSKISGSAKRMSTLIDDLLNFSRLSSTDGLYTPTDLNVVISEVSNDFELEIQKYDAIIKQDILPEIQAITLQMNQLFHNLFSNALKFRVDGRQPVITIQSKTLSQSELSKHVDLDQKLKYHEITFSDNGIGFDQDYAEQIFKIFQRLQDQAAFAGSGIGLALCKKIVLNHHGKIFATGQEGEGARFNILLPVRQPKQQGQ